MHIPRAGLLSFLFLLDLTVVLFVKIRPVGARILILSGLKEFLLSIKKTLFGPSRRISFPQAASSADAVGEVAAECPVQGAPVLSLLIVAHVVHHGVPVAVHEVMDEHVGVIPEIRKGIVRRF